MSEGTNKRTSGVIPTALAVFFSLIWPSMGLAEEWAVVGVRSSAEGSLVDVVETARVLASRFLEEGRPHDLIDEEEVRKRLGAASFSMIEIDEAIMEAEFMFFQLAYEEALAAIEKALSMLSRHVGEEAWEKIRSLRLLATLIHSKMGPEAREAGIGLLEPLAGIDPRLSLDEETAPRELLEMWEEAKARVTKDPEGWLRVDCMGECLGARVWMEGFLMGSPGTAIAVSPGWYTVMVTDGVEGERRSSFPRTVEIASGEELSLEVELLVEANVHLFDGPTLVLERSRERGVLEALAFVAQRLETERLLGVRRVEAQGAATLEVFLVDREGRLLHRNSAALVEGMEEESALEGLVRGAIRQEVDTPKDDGPVFAEANPALFQRVESPSRWPPSAKWMTVAATATMALGGWWLALEAGGERDELRGLEVAPGRYAGVSEGRRAQRLADSVNSKETWSAVLFTGAAVGAVGSLLLFLDGNASTPIVDGSD